MRKETSISYIFLTLNEFTVFEIFQKI
jgi:hypothetical protein